MIRQTASSRALGRLLARGSSDRHLIEYYVALLRQVRKSQNGEAGAAMAVGVTACGRSAGASTVAANLAVAASRTARDPVLLIDANIEAPAVQRAFNLVAGPGMTDLLVGDADLDDCLHPGGHEKLFLLTAGKSAGGEPGVLEPDKIDELVARLKERFAWIVVDLPPVARLSPGLALAGRLDGVLLVIEAGRVRAEPARQAKRRLVEEGARVLGVVLNKDRFPEAP